MWTAGDADELWRRGKAVETDEQIDRRRIVPCQANLPTTAITTLFDERGDIDGVILLGTTLQSTPKVLNQDDVTCRVGEPARYLGGTIPHGDLTSEFGRGVASLLFNPTTEERNWDRDGDHDRGPEPTTHCRTTS